MQSRGVYLLVVAVLAVMTVGLVMLSSTGAFAADSHGDASKFLRLQSAWLAIGLVTAVIVSVTDYHFWQKLWPYLLGLSVLLLILCLPPFGHKINGSYRWIRVAGFSFQPSELAKLASIIFLASWFTKHQEKTTTFVHGFVIPLAVISAMLLLIVRETDLGATLLIATTMFCVMFVAGSRLRYFMPMLVVGMLGVIVVVSKMPERVDRILAYRNLEKYKEGDGLQQYAGLTALGSGGVEGLGLGNGRQKLLYLPFAHTDFIFPVIGEELGLWFTLGIVSAYVVMILCGTMISLCSKDHFGMLLGFGCVMLLAIQAAVNIGVTTALLPNKGMPLPFVSYGGSNLCLCLLFIGILISIHRHSEVTTLASIPRVLAAKTRKTIRL
ncbi:MAG: putative peptidoglycan glycosyltransferase FtsW [Chthoniobacterales bacterium]